MTQHNFITQGSKWVRMSDDTYIVTVYNVPSDWDDTVGYSAVETHLSYMSAEDFASYYMPFTGEIDCGGTYINGQPVAAR